MNFASIKAWIKRLPIPLTKNQRYDMLTTKIIRRHCRRDSNCIDVGALEGEVTRLFLKYAPGGTHYAFEPLPDFYFLLNRRYGRYLKVINAALSNREGSSTFHFVKSNPPYSGIKERSYDRPSEEVEEINVSLTTMDNAIPDDLPVHLIKIDVEGAELLVLEGAGRILSQSHPLIIFEHGRGGADSYDYGPADVFNYLRKFDYQIYRLSDWYRKRPHLKKEEFIALFESGREYYFLAC